MTAHIKSTFAPMACSRIGRDSRKNTDGMIKVKKGITTLEEVVKETAAG